MLFENHLISVTTILLSTCMILTISDSAYTYDYIVIAFLCLGHCRYLQFWENIKIHARRIQKKKRNGSLQLSVSSEIGMDELRINNIQYIPWHSISWQVKWNLGIVELNWKYKILSRKFLITPITLIVSIVTLPLPVCSRKKKIKQPIKTKQKPLCCTLKAGFWLLILYERQPGLFD